MKRGKNKSNKGELDVKEDQDNLVQALIKKLDTSSEIIEDLKLVLDAVQVDFDVRMLVY